MYLKNWIILISRLTFLFALYLLLHEGICNRTNGYDCLNEKEVMTQDIVSSDRLCFEKDGILQRIPSTQRLRKLDAACVAGFYTCSLLHEEINKDAQILKNLFFTKRSFWCIYRL